MTKEKTAVAVLIGSTEVIPEYLKNQQNRGTENVGVEDLVIPRLELVQDLSPCRKKSDPSYIDGIEEGMLYNNVSRKNYGTEVLLIPVHYKKEWLIWKDRESGGGFRGAIQSEAAAKEGLALLEDGGDCEIQDTAQHFCILVDQATGKCEEIVVSMSRSKMKISRKWNSLIRMAGGDSFSRVYRVNAVSDTNDRNQSFYNLNVAIAGFPSEEIYKSAEALYENIVAGNVQVDRRDESGNSSTHSEY